MRSRWELGEKIPVPEKTGIPNRLYHRLNMLAPSTSERTKSARKINNNNLPTEATPPSISPNPKTAANSEITNSKTDKRNMYQYLKSNLGLGNI